MAIMTITPLSGDALVVRCLVARSTPVWTREGPARQDGVMTLVNFDPG
jgi:hypothetical protein